MKKLWLIPLGIVAVGLIGGGILVLKGRSASQTISPGGEKVATPTPKADLVTWKDDAGFSFQYPKDLSVNKHEEDNDSYAHVELTSGAHPGKVIVWVRDLPTGVTTLDSWVKKIFADSTVLDTKLGGEPAKKILTSAPVKMLTVGTISDNLLFSVEATLTDSEYWQGIEDTIVESFVFTDNTAAQSAEAAGGNSGGGEVDEEEVVQ